MRHRSSAAGHKPEAVHRRARLTAARATWTPVEPAVSMPMSDTMRIAMAAAGITYTIV